MKKQEVRRNFYELMSNMAAPENCLTLGTKFDYRIIIKPKFELFNTINIKPSEYINNIDGVIMDYNIDKGLFSNFPKKLCY